MLGWLSRQVPRGGLHATQQKKAARRSAPAQVILLLSRCSGAPEACAARGGSGERLPTPSPLVVAVAELKEGVKGEEECNNVWPDEQLPSCPSLLHTQLARHGLYKMERGRSAAPARWRRKDAGFRVSINARERTEKKKKARPRHVQ